MSFLLHLIWNPFASGGRAHRQNSAAQGFNVLAHACGCGNGIMPFQRIDDAAMLPIGQIEIIELPMRHEPDTRHPFMDGTKNVGDDSVAGDLGDGDVESPV